MKKRTFAILLALCMMAGILAGCGAETATSAVEAPAPESAEAVATEPSTAPTAPPAPEPAESAVESAVESPVEPAAEASQAEPVESAVEEGPKTCTATFSDGQTFEATVGEDFVFFFQCNAPGDMGEPEPGQEGAGITVSDGTVTYSNVGLGGPFSYPTSEKVTISGFTGDFDITITEAATNMGATYTIYTEEADIEAAIAFAEEMAAQQAANPMP